MGSEDGFCWGWKLTEILESEDLAAIDMKGDIDLRLIQYLALLDEIPGRSSFTSGRI